ncbi:MAG: hypothetical protein KDK39_01550 [Leptospiraceae bacterium]|nr:hypothetical protein [Leptospiraceae bacterium]
MKPRLLLIATIGCAWLCSTTIALLAGLLASLPTGLLLLACIALLTVAWLAPWRQSKAELPALAKIVLYWILSGSSYWLGNYAALQSAYSRKFAALIMPWNYDGILSVSLAGWFLTVLIGIISSTLTWMLLYRRT